VLLTLVFWLLLRDVLNSQSRTVSRNARTFPACDFLEEILHGRLKYLGSAIRRSKRHCNGTQELAFLLARWTSRTQTFGRDEIKILRRVGTALAQILLYSSTRGKYEPRPVLDFELIHQ
jgi:hypothetical protein